jgi:hypothetical protein
MDDIFEQQLAPVRKIFMKTNTEFEVFLHLV